MKKIPIGIDNFKEIIEDKYYFVDKSMFIREIWDGHKVILLTRTRRLIF